MEFRHLRYFLAVAQELNFGRAAHKLHIAQPPLSQQIRHLEQHLGVQLFQRSRRKVELTRAGTELVREARQILNRVRRMERLALHLGEGKKGSLVISAGPTVMGTVLRRVLPSFTQALPDVSLEFRDHLTSRSLAGLREGTIDIAFAVPPFRREGLSVESVLCEPLMVALPHDHRFGRRKRISLSELSTEPFVALSSAVARGYHERIIGLCRYAGFAPKLFHETTSIAAMLLLVETGAGVALVPSSLREESANRIVYVSLSDSIAEIQFVAAWRTNDRSPLVLSFLEIMRRALREGRTKKGL
jgi:DNA-binding transcriptional LysR family regulator